MLNWEVGPGSSENTYRFAFAPYTVIEQDLYPVEPHIPLPIGARTAGYYAGCGLGPVRRWPY